MDCRHTHRGVIVRLGGVGGDHLDGGGDGVCRPDWEGTEETAKPVTGHRHLGRRGQDTVDSGVEIDLCGGGGGGEQVHPAGAGDVETVAGAIDSQRRFHVAREHPALDVEQGFGDAVGATVAVIIGRIDIDGRHAVQPHRFDADKIVTAGSALYRMQHTGDTDELIQAVVRDIQCRVGGEGVPGQPGGDPALVHRIGDEFDIEAVVDHPAPRALQHIGLLAEGVRYGVDARRRNTHAQAQAGKGELLPIGGFRGVEGQFCTHHHQEIQAARRSDGPIGQPVEVLSAEADLFGEGVTHDHRVEEAEGGVEAGRQSQPLGVLDIGRKSVVIRIGGIDRVHRSCKEGSGPVRRTGGFGRGRQSGEHGRGQDAEFECVHNL